MSDQTRPDPPFTLGYDESIPAWRLVQANAVTNAEGGTGPAVIADFYDAPAESPSALAIITAIVANGASFSPPYDTAARARAEEQVSEETHE